MWVHVSLGAALSICLSPQKKPLHVPLPACVSLMLLQYWMVVLTPLPLMMIVWAVMRWHVLWRVGWQNELGLNHPTDIKWTPTSTLTYPAIVITVGVMAGMLGLGGGIVLVSNAWCWGVKLGLLTLHSMSLAAQYAVTLPAGRLSAKSVIKPLHDGHAVMASSTTMGLMTAVRQGSQQSCSSGIMQHHSARVTSITTQSTTPLKHRNICWCPCILLSCAVPCCAVQAPLLLELGVQPAVSAASSQAAMLMSSCTSTVVYLVNAALPKDYGTAMSIIGFTGTLFGQVVFNIVVQRTGRSSILVLILAVLFMLASGAAIVVISNAITAIVHTPAKLTATHALEVCTMRGG